MAPVKRSISRPQFLTERLRGYVNALERHREAGSPSHQILIEPPGDDIICDICNALIVDLTIELRSSMALCPTCCKSVDAEKLPYDDSSRTEIHRKGETVSWPRSRR